MHTHERPVAGPSGANERWGTSNTMGVSIANSLSLEDVSSWVGDKAILRDITLQVEPGEVLCLVGPSGSGKTTLLRILAGLESRHSGAVRIDERLVAGNGVFVPPEKRGIGLVFQDSALFPHLNNLDNVMFGLNSLTSKAAREQAMQALSRVGMERFASAWPHQLSGGEQQRVALARAMAPRPGILLMDEPFSSLDARMRDDIRERTIDLLRDLRSTVIIVTHDPEEALMVGDKVALMRNGSILQVGSGRNLYRHPDSLFAARFFSQLNVFRATVANGCAEAAIGAVPADHLSPGSRAAVCLRQDSFVVKPARRKATKGVPGRVAKRGFTGRFELLDIVIEGHDEPVRVRVPAGGLPELVVDVRLQPDLANAMVFEAPPH